MLPEEEGWRPEQAVGEFDGESSTIPGSTAAASAAAASTGAPDEAEAAAAEEEPAEAAEGSEAAAMVQADEAVLKAARCLVLSGEMQPQAAYEAVIASLLQHGASCMHAWMYVWVGYTHAGRSVCTQAYLTAKTLHGTGAEPTKRLHAVGLLLHQVQQQTNRLEQHDSCS